MDTVDAQAGKIAWSVARILIARVAKAVRVQKSCRRRIEVSQSSCIYAYPGLELGTYNVRTLAAVREPGIGHRHRHGLARLFRDQGRDRPASDDCVENTVHVAADPLLAADGQVNDNRHCQALRRVTGADAVLQIEAVQLLHRAIGKRPDPIVPACRRIVGPLRYRVTAIETDVVRRALLEPNLQCVVPGTGFLEHETFKVSGKLRVGVDQISEREGGLAIVRIRLIEAWVRS